MSDKIGLQNATAASQGTDKEDQKSFVNEGKHIAEESLRDAEKILGDTVKQVTALARKHPLEAMVIGFGVGCLVGLVLARR